ncbi:F-box domain-containing protein [Colletotrichum cuscutae]|uniref:F-box domain-containing protein n=1 Tax=Colletotrichum cuscutae TaxID=1209917 RepID=A0AAJ0DNP9_9PEZI|nr:F-box domain-containing protein [Colletotrichum cuscutae]
MSGLTLTTPIDSLPNELLIAILSTFESRELLPLTTVDRRFNGTATTILQHRLLHTAKMEGHEVMLESYHPSARNSTPSMTCRFAGVDFLGYHWTGEEDMDLRDLSHLYSHFRPVVSEETRRMRRVFGRRMPGAPLEQEIGDQPVVQELILDDGELFSQLCTTTSLVKSGPNPGLLASHSNIENGVVRVWRHWLAKAAARTAICPAGQGPIDESTILWADATKNVGLRFSVTDITKERLPVYRGLDEDAPVAYSLHYQGKITMSRPMWQASGKRLTMTLELLVRTSQVLLAMEKSAVQEVVDSGRAVSTSSTRNINIEKFREVQASGPSPRRSVLARSTLSPPILPRMERLPELGYSVAATLVKTNIQRQNTHTTITSLPTHLEHFADFAVLFIGFVMQLDAKSAHAVKTVLMAPAMRPFQPQAVAVM